jgi:hypothetical protein
METFTTRVTLGEDGKLRLEVPCHLPPGAVDVVVVMAPLVKQVDITEFRGLGKEIWEGVDVEAHINELRGEWPK